MNTLNTLKRTTFVGSLLTLAVATAGCGSQPKNGLSSALDTVHINQTPVKNQQAVGFCWAYAMSGMLESESVRNNAAIDLSEEYLGFYHLFLTTYYALKNNKPEFVSEGTGLEEPIELVEAMGVVPESVFSHKFTTEGLEKAMVDRVKSILADSTKTKSLLADQEALLKEVADVFGATPPLPDSTFTYEGKTYTPKSFSKDRLGYDKTNYTVSSMSKDHFSDVIEYVKTSLMDNYSVPIGLAVYKQTPSKAGAFDLALCKTKGCELDGGHAMLVVDFATEGGRYGQMTSTETHAVYSKPLKGLMVKNSWGLNNGLTQDATKPADKLSGGYYTITREYLTPADSDIVGKNIAPTVLLRKSEMHKTTFSN